MVAGDALTLGVTLGGTMGRACARLTPTLVPVADGCLGCFPTLVFSG